MTGLQNKGFSKPIKSSHIDLRIGHQFESWKCMNDMRSTLYSKKEEEIGKQNQQKDVNNNKTHLWKIGTKKLWPILKVHRLPHAS